MEKRLTGAPQQQQPAGEAGGDTESTDSSSDDDMEGVQRPVPPSPSASPAPGVDNEWGQLFLASGGVAHMYEIFTTHDPEAELQLGGKVCASSMSCLLTGFWVYSNAELPLHC